VSISESLSIYHHRLSLRLRLSTGQVSFFSCPSLVTDLLSWKTTLPDYHLQED